MSQRTLQKHISRLMALLLTILLLLPCIPEVRADGESGTCGNNLTWSLSAGTLTISGSGAMTSFSEETFAPWYAFREEILRVELPSGLTNVGDLAFYGCKNLAAVSVPDSVRRIGYYSFGNCTGLQMVNLPIGVEVIDEGAFIECRNLTSLRLPISIASIGTKAFYRCEALTSVTIPQFVVSVGAAAFGYCTGLVSADIQGYLNYLPDFLFYGCSRLSSVTVAKAPEIVSQYAFEGCVNLAEAIEGNRDSSSTSASFSQNNSDGSVTHENVTVTEKDNVSVTTKVENIQQAGQSANTNSAEIDVTVENEEGWKEAINQVDKELSDYQNAVESSGGTTDKVQVNVFIKNETEINADFVEHFVGKDVQINIMTEDGSSWRIQENALERAEFSGQYDLTYILTKGSEDLNKELNVSESFCLAFRTSAEVNAEILIHLGTVWTHQKATLYQRNGMKLAEIQSVIVDMNGYAHFYLASVDKDTEYYIAMNVPADMPEKAPIIPEEMASAYGNVEFIQPIQYEITGRKSSWNMGLGKVMAILAVVMISAVGVIGFVMYFWNKQRLKAGYVPKWDDEDETDPGKK